MKTIAFCSVLCLTAASAFATLSKDEVTRLSESATILTELRTAPDKGIPEDLWDKAQCVVVIPSMKKAAFIVGGEYRIRCAELSPRDRLERARVHATRKG